MAVGGAGGSGGYLNFLNDSSSSDIWIIDRNLELVTRGNHHNRFTYQDLPDDADKVVGEVFSGKTAFSQSFSNLLKAPTLTIGTPILNDGEILGVVLLHSPVEGANAAVKQGLTTLGASLAAALVLSFLLALWLSKSFTAPIISKEAEEALRLDRLRRDFVANISHELKTPVAVLRGSLEALVDGVVTEPPQVESYHREMLSETLYLQRLVGDLLDLSRLQNSDFVIEMQELSLDSLVEDVVRGAAHIANEKGVAVCLQKAAVPQTVRGDYGRLRQMLLIVLDNAVKFSPENGTVEVRLSDGALCVRDHGEGIDSAELPYIFERFYKSRSEQNKTGTGLGLAIARQIAERHHIKLFAKNAEEGGAEFFFQFYSNLKKD